MSATWWRVKLAPAAERDFSGIVQWTRKNFGARQAQIYTATLRNALQALHSGPDIVGAKRRDDIAPGIHTLHVARNGRKGRHFVVFRAGKDDVVEVLRLLHDSMDLPGHSLS
ncbi:MAG: type II toxin-antitoxin system RelE/ParE family toxin [Azoarcus sp.]|jgi:toxin ParE1/3/4|nr:type II toxin-antitoxin system RelE/ParE family toxin [Azoarcus sp.]